MQGGAPEANTLFLLRKLGVVRVAWICNKRITAKEREMTDRKFTPPTEFPAEYVTTDGCKAVVLGKRPGDVAPYVGYLVIKENEDVRFPIDTWGACGSYFEGAEDRSDLHDLPKKQVRWANDYHGFNGWSGWFETREEADDSAARHRIAVIRREWIEGQLPQYFVEEV
jgi:hypothetical protein